MIRTALLSLICSTACFAAATADPALPGKAKAIFDNHCIKCHGDKKQKGELRLDSEAAFKTGGEHGVIFVAGKPDESGIIKAVKRLDPDTAMPPKDKDALSEADVKILSDWIAAGAAWPAAAPAANDGM
jgi:mono/diheme cytochrome c family protein